MQSSADGYSREYEQDKCPSDSARDESYGEGGGRGVGIALAVGVEVVVGEALLASGG
jgi:hypothetical protein